MRGYFSYEWSTLSARQVSVNKVIPLFIRQLIYLAEIHSLSGGKMDILNNVPIEFDDRTAYLPKIS